jgi:glycosyltransferase involved in cell wall biosynthesis
MKDRFFFIDMVCLFDRTYAGIANVNYQIVKYFYQHHKESTYFFHQDQIVRPEVIEVLLRRRDGLGLQEFSQTGRMYVQPLNDLLRQIKGRTVGIYPYLKSFHEKFDYEIQVIYDLTILLTPEFHHPETIKTHIPAWERGVRTNHLCVCISHSTQEDLIQYIGLPKEKTLVSHLGCEPELRNDPVYKNLLQEFKDRVENFILVLGTVEPRKNIQSILTFLEGNPGVLNQHKFLFIGRDGGKDGWGETFREKLMKLRIDENVKSQKIVFLEYVSEEEKNILLMTAEFLIYPSIYEGFGLPVLEALNLGCPVLASMSSSIPEVGEKAIDYLDPYDAKSFE